MAKVVAGGLVAAILLGAAGVYVYTGRETPRPAPPVSDQVRAQDGKASTSPVVQMPSPEATSAPVTMVLKEPSGMEPVDKVLDAAIAKIANKHPGDAISEGRVAQVIERLRNETLEQSLAHADYVDDFYYPGVNFEARMPGSPLGEVHLLLSNRRTMKLLAPLRELPSHERTELLRRYLHEYREQYKEMIGRFKGMAREKAIALQMDLDFVMRLDKAYKKGLPGTANAIRCLVLISALIADCSLCEEIRGWFRYPLVGYNEDLTTIEPAVVQMTFTEKPLFSEPFQIQIAALMKQKCSRLSKGGAFSQAVDEKLASATTTITSVPITNYTSPTGHYDIHHQLGMIPVDESHGTEEFLFLTW